MCQPGLFRVGVVEYPPRIHGSECAKFTRRREPEPSQPHPELAVPVEGGLASEAVLAEAPQVVGASDRGGFVKRERAADGFAAHAQGESGQSGNVS